MSGLREQGQTVRPDTRDYSDRDVGESQEDRNAQELGSARRAMRMRVHRYSLAKGARVGERVCHSESVAADEGSLWIGLDRGNSDSYLRLFQRLEEAPIRNERADGPITQFVLPTCSSPKASRYASSCIGIRTAQAKDPGEVTP